MLCLFDVKRERERERELERERERFSYLYCMNCKWVEGSPDPSLANDGGINTRNRKKKKKKKKKI